jgi:hypothetical protein
LALAEAGVVCPLCGRVWFSGELRLLPDAFFSETFSKSIEMSTV